MIDINDITITYGDTSPLEHFSLHAGKGEKVVIMGASGRGKTSILNSIAGFVVPVKGSVCVDNILLSPSTISAVRQKISYLPQEVNLDLPTGRDLLLYPVSFRANSKYAPSRADITLMMHALGLDDNLLNHKLNELSGGQKQRIALASVLFLRRPVLLLDEPTSALDKASISVVADIVNSLQQTTVISVSHDDDWNSRMQRIITL